MVEFENIIDDADGKTLDISNLKFSQETIFEKKLQASVFYRIEMVNINLSKIDFTGSNFVECNFSNCEFEKMIFHKCDSR